MPIIFLSQSPLNIYNPVESRGPEMYRFFLHWINLSPSTYQLAQVDYWLAVSKKMCLYLWLTDLFKRRSVIPRLGPAPFHLHFCAHLLCFSTLFRESTCIFNAWRLIQIQYDSFILFVEWWLGLYILKRWLIIQVVASNLASPFRSN